jgi:hypothetical protein
MRMFRAIACIACVAAPAAARAAIYVDIGDALVLPGQTAVIGVYAYTDSGDVLNGFNFPLDINNDGNMFPAGFSYNATPIANEVITPTTLNLAFNGLVNLPAGIDGMVNAAAGPNIALGTISSPTKLFDLRIDVSGSVPLNTAIPVSLLTNTNPPVNIFNISGSGSFGGHSNGAIIVAVPEASELIAAASGASLGGLMLVANRRRRASAVAT